MAVVYGILTFGVVSVVRVLANHGGSVHMHHIYKMHSRWTSSQFSAANTPTATTPEDVSHIRRRNFEGKES